MLVTACSVCSDTERRSARLKQMCSLIKLMVSLVVAFYSPSSNRRNFFDIPQVVKVNNFQGDLTDVSAKKAKLVATMRAGGCGSG